MSDKYFLVFGTREELRLIAREKGINPKSIRLVRKSEDMYGCRGGELILGFTGGLERHGELSKIVAYAQSHDIYVPTYLRGRSLGD